MQFVDTNIFIRHLVRDDPQKAQACFNLFQRAERNEVTLTTVGEVIAEVVYILSSTRLYNLGREDIRNRLQPILSLPGFRIPNRTLDLRALELYVAHSIDFEDAVIAAYMERHKIADIYCYDTHFDRICTVNRIEP